MKKILAILLVLSVISGVAFTTEPETASVLFGNTQTKIFEEDLFATVQGTPLTQEEAELVEGEGLLKTIVSGVVGAGLGFLASGSAGAVAGVASSAYDSYQNDSISIFGAIRF